MLWLLIGLLLLVCLVALAFCLLTLWRRVKALGSTVTTVGDAVGRTGDQIAAIREGGPLDRTPCPTCGAPASAATKKPTAVQP